MPSSSSARMFSLMTGKLGRLSVRPASLTTALACSENLVDGHGVHLAAVVIARLDGMLQVAASGLGGEVVGDDMAGAALSARPTPD